MCAKVTAKEIRRLEGPAKAAPIDILEIDTYSGLVVGLNGYGHSHRVIETDSTSPPMVECLWSA